MRSSTLEKRYLSLAEAIILLLTTAVGSSTALPQSSNDGAVQVNIPTSAAGASIPHSPSFQSFSFEPAFWVEFFGNASEPNELTFGLLSRLIERGAEPIIRPGGITQDSMIFNASAGDPVRTTNAAGGVYRTTVGPEYFQDQSWDNFPKGTKFVSTLNFGNNSIDIAQGMAVASVQYQKDKIEYFELGNEPTNYPSSRWNYSTDAYVAQWKSWTAQIDQAVNGVVGSNETAFASERWWASSATTDQTGLHVRPADIIPAGINSDNQVAQYSIHSYEFATCDPVRAALATIPNILNHTGLLRYADEEIYPSAKAALDAGSTWVIGEFNSIACSGAPNVSDTFAQALWVTDMELIYAARNASSVHLHQGATLVFQSADQSNSAGENGTPGFSTYSFVYPRNSSKRGEPRALPSFVSLLFITEALGGSGVQISALDTPAGVNKDSFSSYAFYEDDVLSKIALINMKPFYKNSTEDFTVTVDLSQYTQDLESPAQLKRMTAPYVDEGKTENVTWAGQSFKNGDPIGELNIEEIGQDGLVEVRGSEAVLIFLNDSSVYGL
ncbi:glycoside hydrolase family 79 protein [Diaporthe amygdali]|uniref:glycoside hydrolase family 79 protein n=1 Tax=Phomopsis amygdali TaxID=1214568 RepID=UPI0022FDB9F0|nr:glycoside hydrolase family 79 protein [Diaporthe amygdali]KAJ0114001.1 glycoside hydrolase family 79 protein [Diaporthe amygdali]